MEHTSNNLGDIIKNARQKSKLTIEDLAAKVGITERFLYRIENEGNKPSFAVLFRLIRETLHFSGSDFLSRNGEKQSRHRSSYAYALSMRQTGSGSRESDSTSSAR